MSNQEEGVFWVINGELHAYPFGSVETTEGIAKSQTTYNHKRLWNEINLNVFHKPYDYYPRGRVVINSRGKVTVYMNRHIDEVVLEDIKRKFGIIENPRVIYDGSEHYKCYLD